MHYISTRDTTLHLSGAEAICRGLSREGGLFVPETIPTMSEADVRVLLTMDYRGRASAIMSRFLTDFTEEEIRTAVSAAYGRNFDSPETTPVRKLTDGTWFLELWHGPTCAFKDVALQILPRLMTKSMEKTGEKRDVCIIVATSGDTGKAALEGFRDVPHTKILVFYPKDGVSDVQQLQMQTQLGNNVSVCSVTGNFDDAQSGVKAIFSDPELRRELDGKGWFLSSANSINWGRLLPQIVYYFSAYCDLVNAGELRMGDLLNFCVPTGNFGDILAGYYAKRMGLPVGKLICASNRNDVLTEFLATGRYDRRRPFYTTVSPSMDILISSNLERLLFHASGGNEEKVREWMESLQKTGAYEVDPELLSGIRADFACGCCDDEGTKKSIGEVWSSHRYLMDTHTAVAYRVLREYREGTGDDTPCVVVSTASPFKFTAAVLEAIGSPCDGNGLDLIERLENAAGIPAPAPLASLRSRSVRFAENTEKADMACILRKFLM